MIGDSWTDLGIPAANLDLLIALTHLGNGVLLGGGRKSGAANRLIKSTDYGENWSDKGQIADASNPELESFCNRGSGRVFSGYGGGAGAAAQIWESTDWGENWTLRFSTAYYFTHCIEYCDGQVMCSGHRWEPVELSEWLGRSTNDGQSWEGFNITTTVTDINSLCYLGDSILLAGCGKGITGPGKICRSTDKGAQYSWSDVYSGGEKVPCLCQGANGAIVAGRDNHILRSIDVGQNWTDLGQVADDILADIIYLGSNLFLAVTRGGHVVRSTDNGLTWSDLGKITTGADEGLFCLIFVKGTRCYAGSDAGHLYKSGELLRQPIIALIG